MKNHRIIASWNKIEPDEAADERMLSAILTQNRLAHERKNQGNKLPNAKKAWISWGALAACVIFIALAAVKLLGDRSGASGIQEWSASMPAKAYFKNSKNNKTQGGMPESASLVMMPYAAAVTLTGERSRLESEGILPEMPDHPLQDFQAEYNGDGSLYAVVFWWMRRGEPVRDVYSDLILRAAPEELHEISDVITVHTDENGTVIPKETTQTVRDGITIYGEGGAREGKTLTWQTDQGWYQISGSFNDSYEDMISLLDWFWAHPLQLSRFSTAPEGVILYSSLTEQPGAFSGQLPDFSGLGYTAEKELVNLGIPFEKQIPVWFDGVYTRGETRIRYTISAAADKDAWAVCLGRPNEITEEMVKTTLSQKNSFNVFFDFNGYQETPAYMATLALEQGTSEAAWELIQNLQAGPVQ